MGRCLKLCHTSDWHLGHTFKGHGRKAEHAEFLAFLLDVLVDEAVDALIIAGDIFHTANPPASAQAMFYRFLADAARHCPGLDVVIIAGNHDSAPRLGAADPVLRALRVHIVSTVPRLGLGGRAPVDAEALVVPLHDRSGAVAAQVAALPYLRPVDLPLSQVEDGVDPLVEGVRAVYRDVLDRARARRAPGEALLATGHLTMRETIPSHLSERVILGGDKHALPVDVFADDVDYVALGHLHLAQAVAGREHIRYSGSPIPLSMPEREYTHQLRLVTFEGGRLVAQRAVPIPRTVALYRVPEGPAAELDEVLAQLAALPDDESSLEPPFLEVRVRLEAPMPDLRARIEAALADRSVRLTRIAIEYVGDDGPLAAREPQRELTDLSVEDVFLRAYAERFEGEPSEALMRAFAAVADDARRALEETSS